MLKIKATIREKLKKTEKKSLRKRNKCPAVVYKNHLNTTIELNQYDLQRPEIAKNLCNDSIFLLLIDNEKPITVKIKEIQYHPYELKIIHIDFMYVFK